jgi:hypothetical protein
MARDTIKRKTCKCIGFMTGKTIIYFMAAGKWEEIMLEIRRSPGYACKIMARFAIL